MLVYKNTREVLNKLSQELKDRWNAVLNSDRHTLDVRYTINKANIRMYIVGPEETPYIEGGRGSGKFPPTPKIEDWVKRTITTDLPRVKELTFLIGRKIAEEGTEGKQQLYKIIDELNGKYEMEIFNALKEDVDYHVKSLAINLDKMFAKL